MDDSDWGKENFLKKLFVVASDGENVYLDKDQFRDKPHHLNVFPGVKIPKSFDLSYLKKPYSICKWKQVNFVNYHKKSPS